MRVSLQSEGEEAGRAEHTTQILEQGQVRKWGVSESPAGKLPLSRARTSAGQKPSNTDCLSSSSH